MNSNKNFMMCFYILILSIIAVLSVYILPSFDRLVVRSYAGAITFIGSSAGVVMCAFFVWLMSKGHTKLNNLLQQVYFLMLVIFLCTANFGVFGLTKPPLETWDVIFNIRAAAVCLEAIALYRFFKAWYAIGKE